MSRHLVKKTHNVLFILLLSLLFLRVNGQDTTSIFDEKIDIERENIPVYQALFEISNKIDRNFSYNSDIVDGEKIISLDYKNKPLREILDSVINDSTVKYEMLKQHIILYSEQRPFDSSMLEEKTKEEDIKIEIEGQIFDKKNKKPLPYCNIGLKGKSMGTVTNASGDFILKLPAENYNDTIVVSYLGYKNKSIPVEQLSETQEPIYLEKMSYSIQEVIVRWTNPYAIVTEAISRFNQNYYLKPVHITSFYRETIKRENEYTTFSEAIMKVYKAYNQLFERDQFKVLKSRKNIRINEGENVFMKLKSGLEAILMLDIVYKNINFLSPAHLKNYIYEYKGITHFDDHEVYEINFSPQKESTEPLYSGTLYINVRSLAIVAADFYLNDDNLKKISNSLIIKKKWNMKVKPKQAKYTVNYRQFGNKYFLNQIQGNLTFRVRKKNEFLGKNYKVSFEMISSDIDTSNIRRFDNSEITKPQKVFIEEINDYDPEFWGQYNYILPDEPLKETMKKMNSQIKMLDEL
ncbi:MAG: carboxypeptidase-like regulatory domain-containing protein [Bacteroidales bacterium]